MAEEARCWWRRSSSERPHPCRTNIRVRITSHDVAPYDYGLYEREGCQLFTTAGLGGVVPIRVGSTAEIVVVTLKAPLTSRTTEGVITSFNFSNFSKK